MESIHAFTTSYNGISYKLINSANVIYGDNKYETQMAQWDTGATNTCISEKVVKELNLVPTGVVSMMTPSGSILCNKYRVDIELQNKLTISNVHVIESKIGDQGIDILIGMDVISMGDLSISNFQGKTVFTFRVPSQSETDYVKLVNAKIPLKSTKILPNTLCPCGSGKKYKKCCGKNN